METNEDMIEGEKQKWYKKVFDVIKGIFSKKTNSNKLNEAYNEAIS